MHKLFYNILTICGSTLYSQIVAHCAGWMFLTLVALWYHKGLFHQAYNITRRLQDNSNLAGKIFAYQAKHSLDSILCEMVQELKRITENYFSAHRNGSLKFV